jgi:hypothetical protein
MIFVSLVLAGIVSVASTRGFVSAIRREPGTRATLPEWVVSALVGVLAGGMVVSVLRGVFAIH